jgi:hypothetical protein
MTLSFLDPDAQQELALRVERDLEPEEKRHRQKKGEITQDSVNRHIGGTTVYTGALWGEELDHLRRVARITCSAIFEIVGAESIHLKKDHIEEIHRFLAEPFRENARLAQKALIEKEKQMGLPVHVAQGPTAEKRIQEAVEQETVTEVLIRAKELRRKQRTRKRTWWLERIEKLLWLVVGAVLGVLGTLLTQKLRSP